MAKQFISFNGEIYPEDHPVLTIQNRGFRYGDGLFESMRLMKGELKFASLHAERLQKGLKALKFEGHAHIDTYFLKEKIEKLARRNKTGPNAWARLTVFRDSGGLYSPV
ncbi:MAG TPA: 4-amino-4-deoxychorismate lyase, partial [Sphingobacteriaceae bacterium]|nr:4-amino-4-deoxychorismate lyase [Sphingobacteriaceae bacterium]